MKFKKYILKVDYYSIIIIKNLIYYFYSNKLA